MKRRIRFRGTISPTRPCIRRLSRRGAVIVWLILVIPLVLTMLCVVIEAGNLWLARVELENGLEAAALAAVKEWGEAGGGPTQIPRMVGVEFAEANEVRCKPLFIGNNYTPPTPDNPNGNASCTGNLVFGTIDYIMPRVFYANIAPDCGHFENLGTVGLRVEVDTAGAGSDTTFRKEQAFLVEFKSSTVPGLSIVSIQIDLQAAGSDNGQFDVDTVSPPANETLGPGPREGWGPFVNTSNTEQTRGLTIGSIVFTPDGSSHMQSSTLRIDFPVGDFTTDNPPDRIVFGVDTDMVGYGILDSGDTADSGSDFAIPDFKITINFSNGGTVDLIGNDPNVFQVANKKIFTPPGFTKDLLIFVPPNGDFGVRAQATVPVESICKCLLGIPVGPFCVSAKTHAGYKCTRGPTRLVRINVFDCHD